MELQPSKCSSSPISTMKWPTWHYYLAALVIIACYTPILARTLTAEDGSGAAFQMQTQVEMTDQWNSEFIVPHVENGTYFRGRGQILGSLNYAHLVLDVNLTAIEQNITFVCNAMSDVLKTSDQSAIYGDDRTFQGAPLNGSLAYMAIRRCELLWKDYKQILSIWVHPDAMNHDRHARSHAEMPFHKTMNLLPDNAAALPNDFVLDAPALPANPSPSHVTPPTTAPLQPRNPAAMPDDVMLADAPAPDPVSNVQGTPYDGPFILTDTLDASPPDTPFLPKPSYVESTERTTTSTTTKPIICGQANGRRMCHDESWTWHNFTKPDGTPLNIPSSPRADPLIDFANLVPQVHDVHFSSQDESSSRRRRPRRQVIAGLAFLLGLGIAALVTYLFTSSQIAEVSVSAGLDDDTITLLQDHETRTTVNEESINLIKDSLINIKQDVSVATAALSVMRASLILAELDKELRRIFSGLQRLSIHRLSPDLIDVAGLEGVLSHLGAKVDRRGLKLASQRPEEVFRYDTSHILFTNNTLRILVHIPAYRQDAIMDLYEYVPVPITVRNTSAYAIPVPTGNLLAVDATGGLFRTLKTTDLHRCKRVMQMSYCPDENLYDKRVEDNCMFGLYRSDIRQVSKTCDLQFQPNKDYVVQIDDHTLIMYQAVKSSVERRCGPVIKQEMFQGIRKIRVPPGCRVTSNSFVFDGAQNIFGSPTEILHREVDITHLFPADPFDQHELSSDAFWHNIEKIGTTTGLKIRDVITEFKAKQATYALTITFFGLIFGALALVGCLYCLRARVCLKRTRQQRPNAFFRAIDNAHTKMRGWRLGTKRKARRHREEEDRRQQSMATMGLLHRMEEMNTIVRDSALPRAPRTPDSESDAPKGIYPPAY